jgi:hypothetical protein
VFPFAKKERKKEGREVVLIAWWSDQKTSKFFVSHLEESITECMGVNGVY